MTTERTIAMTGAGGFLGTAIQRALPDGVRVLSLVRRQPRSPDEIEWHPRAGKIEEAKLEGVDAVIHLAGEPIVGLWTPEKKRRIHESRVQGTSLLAKTLAGLANQPRVMISTSAVGYYGDAGDRTLTEDAPPGDDFLARTCVEWEMAADPAREAGIRVVHPRVGLVLDGNGGALQPLIPLFRLGLGGQLGDGRQWMSWIHRDDAAAAFRYAVDHEQISGPANLTAPNPVRNAEFTRSLAAALHRPAFFRVPGFALKATTAGMADALLLASQRALPAALTEAGFHFRYPGIAAALKEALDANV